MSREGPWVFFLADAEGFLGRNVKSFSDRGGLVFRMDAAKFRSPGDVFREFSSRLIFPSYFGCNWDALADCLSRVHGSWHGGRDMVFLIDNSELIQEADFLGVLISSLSEAAENSNFQLDTDGEPTGFAPVAQNFIFLTKKEFLHGLVRNVRHRNICVDIFEDFAFAYQQDGIMVSG
ncbi:barstar family protein [Nocardiopsis quinghaiensis]|uniref:barstar family protein n=1 Tax=Nocardiopsis quinghaiensis TaxID=464995 RepID=UPI001681B8EA|nr:barstar family protein [Nocardiopsis quinghaiensis]